MGADRFSGELCPFPAWFRWFRFVVHQEWIAVNCIELQAGFVVVFFIPEIENGNPSGSLE